MNRSSSHDTIDMTRRKVLMGLAATPFFINPVWASIPRNPAVVIIVASSRSWC